MSPVKDQGSCGSCWAFAATATLESHVALNTGILSEVSPQELVSCMANNDNCGGTGGKLIKFILSTAIIVTVKDVAEQLLN
jgi:cathepsin L